jgi:SAM-dependent methyltransferase
VQGRPTEIGDSPVTANWDRSWFKTLRCPSCRAGLSGESTLKCEGCGHAFPVRDGIPRFVPKDNYSKSFGYQWNLHRLTQLDSHVGLPVSKDRLLRESGWSLAELQGRDVLECGSGAGRFTEVLCESGATVTSLDISEAVDANAASNGRSANLRLLQASIYNLPLAEESFDYLLCLGVIQHTPDVERAFKAMFRYLRPGGRFCIDVYAAVAAYPHLRQLLRPATKRIPPHKLYAVVESVTPQLLPLSNRLGSVPRVGGLLTRLVPVANHRHLGLTDSATMRVWSILDTFDWLSPQFERPQSRRRLERWCRDLRLTEFTIERHRGIHVIRGTK